jgi:hypothetical protein
MRSAVQWFATIALFLTAAKAHGRELRIERQALGAEHVVFGGSNPPVVTALWRAERVRFWTVTPIVAIVFCAGLWRAGATTGTVVQAAVGWAPSLAFTLLGLASIWRVGRVSRAHATGTIAWWTAVFAAAAAVVVISSRARG